MAHAEKCPVCLGGGKMFVPKPDDRTIGYYSKPDIRDKFSDHTTQGYLPSPTEFYNKGMA